MGQFADFVVTATTGTIPPAPVSAVRGLTQRESPRAVWEDGDRAVRRFCRRAVHRAYHLARVPHGEIWKPKKLAEEIFAVVASPGTYAGRERMSAVWRAAADMSDAGEVFVLLENRCVLVVRSEHDLWGHAYGVASIAVSALEASLPSGLDRARAVRMTARRLVSLWEDGLWLNREVFGDREVADELGA